MTLLLHQDPVVRPRERAETVRDDRRRSQSLLYRKVRRFYRRLQMAARAFFFMVVYLAWPILKRVVHPDIVFLVYPGTEKDSRAYFPQWVARFLRPMFPIGFIRYGRIWGLIGATQISAEKLDEQPQLIHDVLGAFHQEFPQVGAVALAGRLPSFVRKAGGSLPPPFVDGSAGTRYAMLNAARELAKKLGKSTSEVTIGVPGGAGYIGSQLVQDLAREFHLVVAIDPRYQDEDISHEAGNVLCSHDPHNLVVAQAVIILTARGDDISDLVSHFRPGVLIADDTHPPIHRPIRERLVAQGADVWKASMADGALRMFPRLPNFRRDDIPGCLVEALTVLFQGREVLDNQKSFNEAAARSGFHARLERHPED